MNENKSKGMNLGGVIQVIFIILKLTHLVDWSWIWVLAPLWISLIVNAIAIIVALKKESKDESN